MSHPGHINVRSFSGQSFTNGLVDGNFPSEDSVLPNSSERINSISGCTFSLDDNFANKKMGFPASYKQRNME